MPQCVRIPHPSLPQPHRHSHRQRETKRCNNGGLLQLPNWVLIRLQWERLRIGAQGLRKIQFVRRTWVVPMDPGNTLLTYPLKMKIAVPL